MNDVKMGFLSMQVNAMNCMYYCNTLEIVVHDFALIFNFLKNEICING